MTKAWMKGGEDELVQGVTRALAFKSGARLAFGIGDDAALLKPRAGFDTILTCDWFLEGSHFLSRTDPPDSVGWKCLARSLSDIAAMGGQPKCFLLSLAIPANLSSLWLHKFLSGLRRAARRFQCPLAGGDTTQRGEVLISVSVVGEVDTGRAVLRSGAKPNDLIFVSGRLGEAELGRKKLRRGEKTGPAVRKHLYPEPRLELGQWLAKRQIATAMMDLSDGLSSDLLRLCRASGVGARIEASKLLMEALARKRARRSSSGLHLALNGGDDYELLFTVSPRRVRQVPASFRGINLSCVGRITRDRRVILHKRRGDQRLMAEGWDPFRRKK